MPDRPPPQIALSVETDGSGPPLLLLPSFASGSESWGVAFVRALAERFRVLRASWPDSSAFAASSSSPHTIADLARAALDALDACSAGTVRVLGWGLGGMVALRLADDAPGRVERMAILGGAGHGAPLIAQAPTVTALCGVAEGASAEEHMLGLLDRLVSPAWRAFAEMFLPQILPRPAATLATLRRQWAVLPEYDLRPRLTRIRAPTLVLAGAEDTLVPPAAAQELAGVLPNARLRLIAGAGHAAMWEQPAAVLAAVASFLEPGGREEEAGPSAEVAALSPETSE